MTVESSRPRFRFIVAAVVVLGVFACCAGVLPPSIKSSTDPGRNAQVSTPEQFPLETEHTTVGDRDVFPATPANSPASARDRGLFASSSGSASGVPVDDPLEDLFEKNVAPLDSQKQNASAVPAEVKTETASGDTTFPVVPVSALAAAVIVVGALIPFIRRRNERFQRF